MASVENRAKWTDLVGGVGLEIGEVFNQALEEYTPGIGSVLITSTGEGAQKNFTGKTGVGELTSFDEGDAIPGGTRYKTYTTKVNYSNYGKYLQVTANQIADRDFASELDEMADLSIGARFSQDRSGMQLFNGGFSTTTTVNGYEMTWYGDDVPQFSTVHPTVVPGGSTQSNASSTSISFGDTNLETGRVAMTLQQTDDGLPISLAGKMTTLVPFNLDKDARQVTMSQLVSETANNAINIYKGGSVDMISSQFLDNTNGGSDTAWYLIVPQRAKLYHEVREQAQLDSDVDILSKTMTFTVSARWANYSKDWRRSWGSKGDGTDYSS